MRFLYACLTPLEERAGASWKTYEDFLKFFPVPLNSLRCRHVLQFLRRTFKLLPDQVLLVGMLIDEGNAPEEPFPRAARQPSPKVSGFIYLMFHMLCRLIQEAIFRSICRLKEETRLAES